MSSRNKIEKCAAIVCLGILFLATQAFAISPTWMPGFPMRMGPNVMLMWTPIPGATGYNIYKSDKEGDLGKKIPSPMNNYMDINVPMDTSVYYTIKAIVAGGAEGDASTAGAIIGVKPLDPPKWVGHMASDGQVAIRFERVTGAAFYNIFKAEAKEGPYQVVGSIQETKYVDATIEVGKTYYYQADAVDKNNAVSPKSEIYEVVIEKKVVIAKAKAWDQVDIIVEHQGNFVGSEGNLINQPAFLLASLEEGIIYVSDSVNLKVLDLGGEVIREYNKPADYTGQWGRFRGMSLSSFGTILTTWYQYNGVRSLKSDGTVDFEFQIVQPTREEYEVLDRLDDWEKDKNKKAIPMGIVEDPEGRLWVTDPVFGQLHIYTSDGELIQKIGEPRPRGKREDGNFAGPSLLRYHAQSNRIYVMDGSLKSFMALDATTAEFVKGEDGEPIYAWRRAGTSPGNFQEQRGFGFTQEGDVVVTDGIDGRVMLFDLNFEYKGSLITEAGEKKITGITSPGDVQVMENLIFIAEPLGGHVSVYSF